MEVKGRATANAPDDFVVFFTRAARLAQPTAIRGIRYLRMPHRVEARRREAFSW